MNEDSAGDIQQILKSFDTYLAIYEARDFPRKATIEEIKTAFKVGHFVEKTIENFKNKNGIDKFMSILEKYWQKNSRIKCYSVDFFVMACDRILCNFFEYSGLSEKTLDIVVRIYTSLFPKERFQCVVSDLLLNHSSIQAIIDFARDDDDGLEEYVILLNSLLCYYEKNGATLLITEIESFLSISKVEHSLYLLVGILTLNNLPNNQNTIQNHILDCLLQKMMDRSILVKLFWVTLCKNVDKSIISKACLNFNSFLTSLLNFLIYLGSFMESHENNWVVNENISFCPEINFHDIVNILKTIARENSELKEIVISRLNEAKENTENQIFDDIKTILT